MCCLKKGDISWIRLCVPDLVKGNIVRKLWIWFWSQAGWRLFCFCCCCLFLGFFLKQNSPELDSSSVIFPWCSNSEKSWTAQIAACQPNKCSTSFFFSPPSTPHFQTPWNVSFSWQCLWCSGGSGVEWRCQISLCSLGSFRFTLPETWWWSILGLGFFIILGMFPIWFTIKINFLSKLLFNTF